MFKRLGVLLAVLAIVASCGGAPATIEFVSIDPAHPRLNQIATVTFKLEDYRGVPLEGAPVNFHLTVATPGVTLTPMSGMSIKGAGTASVQLTATSTVTSVTVVADAGGRIAVSPPISFAGSVANARQFTFQCGEFAGNASGGVHALGAWDPERHLIAGDKLDCIAHVADRVGDGLQDSLVSFMTEAGTIGPTETSLSDVIGNAQVLYKTSLPIPLEVDPGVFTWNPNTDDMHTGAYLVPLWMVPNEWTSNPFATLYTGNPPYNAANLQEPRRPDPIRRNANGMPPINNPRDNLVAMVAVTAGEEGYDDLNANGVHDTDEPFDDLTEPFVDSNDDGTWNDGEKFIDTNGNGTWDGKNGKYDPNTLIWVQERIIWTGIPIGQLFDTTNDGDYGGNAPTVHASQIGFSTPPPPIFIDCGTCQLVTFALSDPWFNAPAQNGQSDGCQTGASGGGMSPVTITAAGLSGLAFDYPSVGLYSFNVCDNLDRQPQPMTCPAQPGCFPPAQITFSCPPSNTSMMAQSPALGFSAPIKCNFTSSPQSGYVTTIPTGVSGLISRNTIP